MSLRDSVFQQGVGGSGGGNAPKPPTQLYSGLSLDPSRILAVDGSPLQMDHPVAESRPNPMPSNMVDAEAFHGILEGRQVTENQSEFPLRAALSIPNTTVYTNHFAMKLDPKTPLYEYNITGLPKGVGRRTARLLVQDAIDSAQFSKIPQDKFATDYKDKLILWVKLPDAVLNPISVRSAT
jgi:eukaryotic translation initiation factor 2C